MRRVLTMMAEAITRQVTRNRPRTGALLLPEGVFERTHTGFDSRPRVLAILQAFLATTATPGPVDFLECQAEPEVAGWRLTGLARQVVWKGQAWQTPASKLARNPVERAGSTATVCPCGQVI